MSQATPSSSPTKGQEFLATLRNRTADSHQALEATPVSQSIAASDITIDTYVRYLQIMERVVLGIKDKLQNIPGSPDIHLNQKLEALASDLSNLSAGANPFPAFTLANGDNSTAYAWGVSYVLEGSNLGGRVILKSLPEQLQLTELQGATYFAGYGKDTGPIWKAFINDMCRFAEEQQAAEAMIRGAEDTFNSILHYFNQCYLQSQKAAALS